MIYCFFFFSIFLCSVFALFYFIIFVVIILRGESVAPLTTHLCVNQYITYPCFWYFSGESERERREREEEAQCLMLIWWLNPMQKTPCKTLPQTKRTSRAVSSAARSLHSPATSRHTWGYTPGRSPSPAPSVPSGSATAATGKNTRGFTSGEPCSLWESHVLLIRDGGIESCVM